MSDVKVSINTNKLQAQLKAIAKHVESLSEELEQIEAEACPECYTRGDQITVRADNEVIAVSYECPKCGCQFFGEESD